MKETLIRSRSENRFIYFKNGDYFIDEEFTEPLFIIDEFDWNNAQWFTGLTDKNGKKIFEGDIVRILYTDWCSKPETDTRTLDQYLTDIASVGVVIWEGDKYYVSIKSKKYKDTSFNDSIFPGKHGYIEVIGNIHDNQDLL